jgi:hypothetical protein
MKVEQKYGEFPDQTALRYMERMAILNVERLRTEMELVSYLQSRLEKKS